MYDVALGNSGKYQEFGEMARIETQIPRRKKPAQGMELESEWEMDHCDRGTNLKMTPDRMRAKGVVSEQRDDSSAQQPRRSPSTI